MAVSPSLGQRQVHPSGDGCRQVLVPVQDRQAEPDPAGIRDSAAATTSTSEEFLGEPLDVLHILVTDSAADRLREVAPDTYEALPADSRGAVEYYRKGGVRQTLTTRESYEALPPERQGRIRYYRRERPRLAEVEVWTWGDNLNYNRGRQGGKTFLWLNAQQGVSEARSTRLPTW